MDSSSPQVPQRRAWSAPSERIVVQVIHWFIVLVVALLVFVLAINNDLDHASVTALYGAILGHAGTAASQKLSSRSTDRQ